MGKNQRRFTTLKRNTRKETKLDRPDAPQRAVVDPQLTPQSQALQQEKSRSIQNGLNQLSTEQRKVIELRNFQHLSFAEIGKQMGRTEDAARKFWARAIESLKATIRLESPGLIDSIQGWPNEHE